MGIAINHDLRAMSQRLRRAVVTARTDSSGPMRAMFRQWGVRYLAFTRRRFVAYSRGGGDWKPLAPSTILARRAKGGGTRSAQRAKLRRQRKRSRDAGRIAAITARIQAVESGAGVSILRDTGTLLAALSPGAPGNLFRFVSRGVVVGFENSRHPSGKATIAQIAAWHNLGGRGGRLPRRTILAPPDAATQRGMLEDAGKAYKQIMRGET